MMKLLIQPGDSVGPLVKGINDAKSSVEVLIFRFDRIEIETALVKAVSRGVAVRALIAYTNRGGERGLRALEMRLLKAGVTVARTDDDLIRYHGKMMIIDKTDLYLMSFNLTQMDIERSRSFAVITDDKETVQEALKLFDADSKRQAYTPGLDTFVVSPINARKILTDFIKSAKKELLIYDPAVGDPAICRVLEERSKAGVKVRILGKLNRTIAGARAYKLWMRLHTRMMVRDGEAVFMGSQSLRTAELDARREVGLIFQDDKVTARLIETFEEDWRESSKLADQTVEAEATPPPARKVAKKVAKSVAETLPPVTPVLEVVVRELGGANTDVDVDPEELEATVKEAVKSAIREVVANVVEQASRNPQ
jgi:phosphatidylserine/phosphatidylglycerophosphate/cardiolipin synthase-like enzyme